MDGLRALLLSAAAASSGLIAAAQSSDPNVLVTHGVLTRNGKAGTLWTLKTNEAPQVRDEAVRQVTFTTRPGENSEAFVPYDGKAVELTGEVKSVFHGNAMLSRVRVIGLTEVPPLSSLAATALAPVSATRDPASDPAVRVPYRHAYYLFLSSAANGCKGCYVPLLITQRPLEEIAEAENPSHCVLITTFERDSIWEIRGAAVIEPHDVEKQPRMLRLNGKSYRYQEISPAETSRLLEHPAGSIPISRPMIFDKMVPGASVSQLSADFRALLAER